jgi:hypothetical protein
MIPVSIELLANVTYSVIPAKAGIQNLLKSPKIPRPSLFSKGGKAEFSIGFSKSSPPFEKGRREGFLERRFQNTKALLKEFSW